MAIQDIRNYLKANRGKYPQELLIAELRKTGHAESEIQEALKSLSALGSASVVQPQNIWAKVGWFVWGFIVGAAISSGVAVGAFLLYSSYLNNRRAYSRYSPDYASQKYIFFAVMALAVIASFGLSLFFFIRRRRSLPYFARGILTGTIVADVALLVLSTYIFLIFGYF